MQDHFKPKNLLFYGIMIGSVTLLFQVVSRYGEAHLEAPPDIAGEYITTQSPPGCAASTHMVLKIQQSGVYLNAYLAVEDSSDSTLHSSAAGTMTTQETLSLTGQWNHKQINLSGLTSALADCQIPENSTDSRADIPITVQGTIRFGTNSSETEPILTGELVTGGEFQLWEFTAPRQPNQESESSDH